MCKALTGLSRDGLAGLLCSGSGLPLWGGKAIGGQSRGQEVHGGQESFGVQQHVQRGEGNLEREREGTREIVVLNFCGNLLLCFTCQP